LGEAFIRASRGPEESYSRRIGLSRQEADAEKQRIDDHIADLKRIADYDAAQRTSAAGRLSESPTDPIALERWEKTTLPELEKQKIEADRRATESFRAYADARDNRSAQMLEVDKRFNAESVIAKQERYLQEQNIAERGFGYETELTRRQLEIELEAGREIEKATMSRFGLTPTQQARAQTAYRGEEINRLGRESDMASRIGVMYRMAAMNPGTTDEEAQRYEALAQAEDMRAAGYSEEQIAANVDFQSAGDREAFLAGRSARELDAERARQRAIRDQIRRGRQRLAQQSHPVRRMGETPDSPFYHAMGGARSDDSYHAMGYDARVHGFISAVDSMAEAVRKATDAHNQPDSGPVQTLPVY